MRLVKLLLGEVIKIQLSSRIIKNTHITYAEEGISVADIKLDVNIQNNLLTDEPNDEAHEDINENIEIVNIDLIKEEITKKIYLENKQERQALINNAIKEAREEAEKLKKEAIEEGYKEGFKQGYDKGITDCLIECKEIKRDALNLIDQAEKEVKRYFSENQDNIIRLAGDMAESIVHTTIDISSESVLLLVKPIIDLNERNELIVITCQPDNFDFLKKNKAKLEVAAPNARFVILKDNNLEKNGCIIENENQIIDLQIKKQVASIIKDILSLEG